MENNIEIRLEKIHEILPVFCITDTSPSWGRVFGATYSKPQSRWLFPAFPPFIQNVLQDLPKVHDNITFSEEALNWPKSITNQETWRETLNSRNFPVKSYDHQLAGTAELLYNYRWILHWETGTGKSKVLIDAVSILQCKTLILCPLIAVDNWVDEINKHSDKTLKICALTNKTKQAKLKTLEEHFDADILVASYDTARLFSSPKLFGTTVEIFKKRELFPSPKLKQILQKINDPKLQERYAEEWTKGKKPKEIDREITEIIGARPQWLKDFPYTTIVADESHRTKHISSGRTKAALKLSGKAIRRYCLTATLSHGNPGDLYPQLQFLAPYIFPESWYSFCASYFITARGNNKIIVGYRGLDVLNRKVERVSSERKLKDCIDLPERRFSEIRYNLSRQQVHDYNYAVNSWEIVKPDASIYDIQNAAIRLSKLLQICSGFVYLPPDTTVCDSCLNVHNCVDNYILPGTSRCIRKDVEQPKERESLLYSTNPKLEALIDKLTDLTEGSKVIVWTVLTKELDIIENALRENKWGYVRVDGTTTKNVKDLVNRFSTDPNCRVYLAQISTGISITLNAAKHSIYFSRSWSLDDRIQSLGRNLRIGQDEKTVVYDLYAPETIELRQLTALNNKQNIAELLTKRINCPLCERCEKCMKDNVKPWGKNCILKTTAGRVVTTALPIHED